MNRPRYRAFGLSALAAGFFLSSAVALDSAAATGIPTISRVECITQRDHRVTKDRLHAQHNPHHEDDAFLNAVGAVWPYGIGRSPSGFNAATGHDAATGFLIDQCHVLTNMHVVYTASMVVDPPVGKAVAFAVGQTEGEKDRGALQGLKFLLQGVVVAHGDTSIVDHSVHDPDNDWAVMRLASNVDESIKPMSITAVEPEQIPIHLTLSAAGFPADHRKRRGDGFKLKDMWGSEGQLVGVVSSSAGGAFIQTTIQMTPGNSGGPIYGDLDRRKHVVIGMVQSFRGNGIDVTEGMPNVEVLFTSHTVAEITEAQERTPCR